MVAGEFAVVRDGDPNSSTGRSVYLCFEPGVVKRLADYEDIQDMVADVAEEYIQDFDDAASAARSAATSATSAASSANSAASAATAAAEDAEAAVQTINNKQDKLTWDSEPTSGSTNPVTSDGIYKSCVPLWVDFGTVSSLPVTKSVSGITADMMCTAYLLGTPSAQTGDWTVTTAAGSVTVSGNISGSTALEIKLEKVTAVTAS